MPQVGKYKPHQKDEVISLMGGLPFKEDIWDWQFESNPFGYKFDPVVLEESGHIMGFNAGMDVQVLYNGEIAPALWSCDFFVHENCRGKGVGQVVKDEQIKKSDLIMSFGISNMAAPVLLKKGWVANEDVLLFKRYKKIDSVKKCLLVILQFFNRMLGVFRFSSGHGSGLNVIEVNELPSKQEVDELWNNAKHSYKKIVIRNYDYLHWKYEQHPLAQYHFIEIRNGNELKALAVVREHNGNVKLIDLLAHAEDLSSRLCIIKQLEKSYPSAHLFLCTTTDRLLQKSFLKLGYFKAWASPRFFVRSELDNKKGASDWFLMTGDSDGELLSASADSLEACHNASHEADTENSIEIEVIRDGDRFLSLRDEWRVLSANSNANPLFLGWEWQYNWWKTWSNILSLDLFLLAAYKGNELVGIAPLYIDDIKVIKGVPVKRLQFIGNVWRKAETVRTEYLEFLVCNEHSKQVCEAFLGFIRQDKTWDEFLICDLVEDSDTYRALKQKNIVGNWYVLERDTDIGVNVKTKGDFSSYLSTLGKSTRLKLFNRRTLIENMGEVNLVSPARAEIGKFFSKLNEFHKKRWGKDCFSGHSLDFHNSLLASLPSDENCKLSFLIFDDQVVSVLYNLKMGNKVFNIQSGFIENFNKKISLGTLHLGYAIEQSFVDDHSDSFDLLAGEGKNSFYKEKYQGDEIKFYTMQIVRKKRLKYVYKIFFVLPKKYRDILSKHLLSR